MNPVIEAIKQRRSIRAYQPKQVSRDLLRTIIEAANEAPSAMNSQPWRFVVVKDPGAREAFSRRCFSGIFSRTRFAAGAPVIIALCAERAGMAEAAKSLKDGAMYQLDLGIAGEHMALRAAEQLQGATLPAADREAVALKLPLAAKVRADLGLAHLAAGDLAAAEDLHRRSLAIKEKALKQEPLFRYPRKA